MWLKSNTDKSKKFGMGGVEKGIKNKKQDKNKIFKEN
jgi:hypothetical protein